MGGHEEAPESENDPENIGEKGWRSSAAHDEQEQGDRKERESRQATTRTLGEVRALLEAFNDELLETASTADVDLQIDKYFETWTGKLSCLEAWAKPFDDDEIAATQLIEARDSLARVTARPDDLEPEVEYEGAEEVFTGDWKSFLSLLDLVPLMAVNKRMLHVATVHAAHNAASASADALGNAVRPGRVLRGSFDEHDPDDESDDEWRDEEFECDSGD